jgi:hypothetical protein
MYYFYYSTQDKLDGYQQYLLINMIKLVLQLVLVLIRMLLLDMEYLLLFLYLRNIDKEYVVIFVTI